VHNTILLTLSTLLCSRSLEFSTYSCFIKQFWNFEEKPGREKIFSSKTTFEIIFNFKCLQNMPPKYINNKHYFII
jgi:hypothetical protein